VPFGIESAGRWALLHDGSGVPDAERVELLARALLRRYGVVFKRILAREPAAPSWRELMQVYRRLEARGEIRGGRFVSGMSGEQFALPEAVSQLRAIRRQEARGSLVALGAADPLNFTGVITPGERIAAVGRNRILYRDGVPVLALESGEAKALAPGEATPPPELVQALVRKRLTPALRAHLALPGVPAESAVPGKRSARRRTKKAAAKEV
jgi:ATP-dependent Lhr-like helicase